MVKIIKIDEKEFSFKDNPKVKDLYGVTTYDDKLKQMSKLASNLSIEPKITMELIKEWDFKFYMKFIKEFGKIIDLSSFLG